LVTFELNTSRFGALPTMATSRSCPRVCSSRGGSRSSQLLKHEAHACSCSTHERNSTDGRSDASLYLQILCAHPSLPVSLVANAKSLTSCYAPRSFSRGPPMPKADQTLIQEVHALREYKNLRTESACARFFELDVQTLAKVLRGDNVQRVTIDTVAQKISSIGPTCGRTSMSTVGPETCSGGTRTASPSLSRLTFPRPGSSRAFVMLSRSTPPSSPNRQLLSPALVNGASPS